MQTLEVELPEKVSTNVFYRRHFRERSKTQDWYYTAVHDAVRRAKLAPVASYPVEMTYSFKLPGNPLDNLNLSAMAKMLEDGLRHAGILREDTPAEVAGVFLEQTAFRVKRATVTISWTRVRGYAAPRAAARARE